MLHSFSRQLSVFLLDLAVLLSSAVSMCTFFIVVWANSDDDAGRDGVVVGVGWYVREREREDAKTWFSAARAVIRSLFQGDVHKWRNAILE